MLEDEYTGNKNAYGGSRKLEDSVRMTEMNMV